MKQISYNHHPVKEMEPCQPFQKPFQPCPYLSPLPYKNHHNLDFHRNNFLAFLYIFIIKATEFLDTLVSVQFSCLVMSDSLRPHEPQHSRPPYPSPTARVYRNPCLLSLMPSNHLIVCRPLLLLSIFPSIRVSSHESALRIRWSKYWSFSFNISPSNEHPGLISFSMDRLDLFAVQGTQSSSLTPWFKSINSSVLSFLYSPTLHGHT